MIFLWQSFIAHIARCFHNFCGRTTVQAKMCENVEQIPLAISKLCHLHRLKIRLFLKYKAKISELFVTPELTCLQLQGHFEYHQEASLISEA